MTELPVMPSGKGEGTCGLTSPFSYAARPQPAKQPASNSEPSRVAQMESGPAGPLVCALPKTVLLAARQYRTDLFVRPEIFRAVDVHQLGEPCAGAIDARFDSADRAATNIRCFLVGEAGGANQH